MKLLKTRKMQEWASTLRREGLKGFVKLYGKRVLFWFILIYLIRDTVLYIIIPYLIAKGILSCFTEVEEAFR